MLVYRHLLTITLTWQSSHVIANYNQKTSKIYLFKHVILLFQSWWCKEAHMRNIVPVIDGGVFHNYVHMWACFIIMFSVQAAVFVWCNQKPLQSIDTSFMSFSPFYKGVEEKGKKWRIKERPWCSGRTFFRIADL